MQQMFRALPWALATMAVALADAADLIPAGIASTLVITLPLLMVVTMSGKNCASRTKAA